MSLRSAKDTKDDKRCEGRQKGDEVETEFEEVEGEEEARHQ
jgi:hypothetical protein